MIFCTIDGTQHQDDDKFCKKCGNPLPKGSASGGEKIIHIPRYLAKRCLMENLDYRRDHQEWATKKYGYPYAGRQKHSVWIQFNPATGECARLLVTRIFDEFDDQLQVGEDLSQLKPGWHYYRMFDPTKEWEVDVYLDSPCEDMVELNQGEYKGRFV